MKISRPSHATAVAYLALFVAFGGSAYAVSKVGTDDLQRSAVTSPKIENEAVRSRDIADATIGTREMRFRPLIRSENPGDCDPTSGVPIECARFGIRLEQRGGIIVIASGGQYSVGRPASGVCQVDVGEGGSSTPVRPGESTAVNTDPGATNGFTQAFSVSDLPAGPHSVVMLCSELAGDLRIQPSLGAVALPGATK